MFSLWSWMIIILLLLVNTSTTFGLFTLTVSPSNHPVIIGEEAVLTCKVKGIKLPMNYAVLFKRKDKIISEKCQVYAKEKYHLVCEPDDEQNAHTFKLHIKSVSWADRGIWSCIYAANLTEHVLEVYAPAKLEKMSVKHIFKEDNSLEMATIYGQIPALGNLPTHVGLGTRTNPYDLRPNMGMELTCETTCGYPRANISWLIINETMTRSASWTNQVNSDQCENSLQTAEMSRTASKLEIDCNRLNLIGLNQVECTVKGPQYKQSALSRHVYVLCPGGERPMKLTNGEVVGIAVGSALALILLFLVCVILRNNNNNNKTEDESHRSKSAMVFTAGQRV